MLLSKTSTNCAADSAYDSPRSGPRIHDTAVRIVTLLLIASTIGQQLGAQRIGAALTLSVPVEK